MENVPAVITVYVFVMGGIVYVLVILIGFERIVVMTNSQNSDCSMYLSKAGSSNYETRYFCARLRTRSRSNQFLVDWSMRRKRTERGQSVRTGGGSICLTQAFIIAPYLPWSGLKKENNSCRLNLYSGMPIAVHFSIAKHDLEIFFRQVKQALFWRSQHLHNPEMF